MMRFGSPGALWLLAVLPLIVFLYMLRARRQPFAASSILLWQRARRDLAAQRPIRRLERSLLLLLQLLGVALVVLALAQPQLPLRTLAGGATVIVMDVSASMQATDVRPSRFEAARREALAVLETAGGPVMVITAGPVPRIAMPFGDPRAALAVMAVLRPTDGAARLDQAVALAAGQRTAQGRPTVVVFTDRAGPAADRVTYRVIGTASRNLGIAGLHAERTPRGARVVVQVANTGGQAERVPVSLFLDDRKVLTRTVPVPAGGVAAMTAAVEGEGILRAVLHAVDPLASDNTAYAIVGGPQPRVLVVGEQERPLEEALAALSVRRAPGQRVTAEALASADVVILNHTPPVPLPPGNYLLIGTLAANLPVTADGVARGPVPLRWSKTHPIMRYVDLGDLQIAEALALRPAGGEVLAEGEVPLIWSYEGNGIRAVVLGFTLAQSDLPLRIAFPILLSNTLAWLGGTGQSLVAGQPLVVPAGTHREAVLTDPSGARTPLAAGGGSFVMTPDRAGMYVLAAGSEQRRLAVNVAAEESVIAPVFPPPAAGAVGSEGSVQRLLPLWALCVVLGLAVVLFEWVIWLRSLPKIQVSRSQVVPR